MVDALSLPSTSASSPTHSPSFGLLAAIPGAYLAAYGILVTSLQTSPIDTLLVQGGSSAVGMAAASIAKHLLGVKRVVGTTRTAAKVDRMRAGGYDAVVVLPRTPTQTLAAGELADTIKKASNEPTGFTTVVDLIGATNVNASLLCASRVGGSRVCMAGMLAGAYHFQEPFSPMSIVSQRRISFVRD